MSTPAIASAIGNTPLVRLRVPDRPDVAVWAKLEGCNPGGSAKDRSAWGMLQDALGSGRVAPGGTIIESSSRNLEMALTRLCTALGIGFECVADQHASPVALARREGILTGASGGAVYWALLNRAVELPADAVVALILHDFGWGYLDTVHDDAWVAEHLQVSATQLATRVDDLLVGGAA